MIETLSNGVWSATAIPTTGLNPPAVSIPRLALGPISCLGVNLCVVAGFYRDSTGTGQEVVGVLANGTWTGATVRLNGLAPARATGQTSSLALSGISCPVTGSCTIVGTYDTSANGTEGLIETLSNGVWSVSTAPVPAPGVPTLHDFAGLYGVSCPAVGVCVAVGNYASTPSDPVAGLVETLAGGTWTATTAPTSGLRPPPTSNAIEWLFGVSCPAVGICVAVGYYMVGTEFHGLVVTLSAGTWTASEPPASGLGTGPIGFDDVSCPAPGACVAVGSYIDVSNRGQSLVETLSGGVWTATAVATTGLDVTTTTIFSPTHLSAVSCPTVGECVSVGGYVDSSTNGQGLVVSVSTAPDRGSFTDPNNGEVKVDSTRPFTWSKFAGAQAYYLVVGTTPYGTDLVDSGILPVTASSTNVADLPAGKPLYATLLTKINGSWSLFQATTFTAAVGHATFTYPVNGERHVTAKPFTWSPVPSAEAYYVVVGTTVFGSDIVNSSILPPSQTALPSTSLPLGKILYATLLTEVNGGWRYQLIAFIAL